MPGSTNTESDSGDYDGCGSVRAMFDPAYAERRQRIMDAFRDGGVDAAIAAGQAPVPEATP